MAGRWAAVAAVVLLCAGAAHAALYSFDHGVASGDPLPTAVIIWTRLTPRPSVAAKALQPTTTTTYTGTWQVSRSRSFDQPEQSGTFSTSASVDYTVKVDVSGLSPAVQYYYRFLSSDGFASPTGRFKLPKPAGQVQSSLRYAIFSCSNWGFGYFNAYDLAARYPLDFWVHLGDFIYEYGTASYPAPQQAGRYNEPPLGLQPATEIVSLSDYRQRYATYRRDPALQALSASSPLIAIWDDHESANNAWMGGAENHNSTSQGSWEARKAASIQAYHEWMPIRSTVNGTFIGANINRSFQFGQLATLILAEGRLTGRTQEPSTLPGSIDGFTSVVGLMTQAFQANPTNPTPFQLTDAQLATLQGIKAKAEAQRWLNSSKLLGDEQLAWFDAETKRSVQSKTTWQLYGHGTVMLDWWFPDMLKAIELMSAKDASVAAQWQQALDNVTLFNPASPRTYLPSSPLCYNENKVGKPQPVTVANIIGARAAAITGKYKINWNTDGWQGFQAEKRRLMAVNRQANNAIVYGGDSHNDYAGIEVGDDGKVIHAEFNGASVTSSGFEDAFGIIPLDLLSNGTVAASSGLTNGSITLWADQQHRGFMYITLDGYKQHIEYLKVDNICQPNYKAYCVKAFDRYTKKEAARRKAPDTIIESSCAKIPSGTPYAVIQSLNTEPFQVYSALQK